VIVPGGYNPWDLAGDSWLDHDAARAAINFFPEKPEAMLRASREGLAVHSPAMAGRDRRQPVRLEAPR
jgi:hypothetical protein